MPVNFALTVTVHSALCVPTVAVIFVGEDLDVLLELSDKILVLCGGKVSGIVDAGKTDKNEVGMMMTRVGGSENHE